MHRRNLFLVTALLVMVAAMIGAVLFAGGEDRPGGAGTVSRGEESLGAPDRATGTFASGTEAMGGESATGAGRTELTGTTGGAPRQVRCTGRLVDSGSPVAELELTWRPRFGGDFELIQESLPERGEATLRTDADGRFTLVLDAGGSGTIVLPRDANLLFDDTGSRRLEIRARGEDLDLGDVVVEAAASVAGRVVDEAGQPVEGARVRANPVTGLFWMPGQGVVTAGDGEFLLEGLGGGRHRIGASAPGFVPALHEVDLEIGERTGPVEVVLKHGESIAGTVVDDRGAPIEGAKVAAFRAQELSPGVRVRGFDASEAVITDTNGYFVLSGVTGERATVRAWIDGHATEVAGDVPVGTATLVLRLPRLGSVAGVLRDTAGRGIAGSTVTASAIGEAPIAGELSLARFEGSASRTATTDAEGRFEIAGVSPGTVTLTARGDGHLPVEGRTVQVQPGSPTTNVLLVAEVGAGLDVLVVDADGQPVEGAFVFATRPEPPPVEGEVRRSIRIGTEGPGAGDLILDGEADRLAKGETDAEGRVRLTGLPAGPAVVNASHPDFAAARPVEVTLPRLGVVEVVTTLRPAGFVSLTALDASGQPASGVRWVLRGPEGAEDSRQRGVTGDDGTDRIGPLAEGSYELYAELEPARVSMGGTAGFIVIGDDGELLEDTRVPVVVRGGETSEVSLRLPMLTRVVGTVTDAAGPVRGALVRIVRDEGGALPFGGRDATTDGEGRFAISDVTPGSYRLEYGRANQVMPHVETMDVPPGTAELVRDLRLTGGTLRVTVVDASEGRPVPRALVELLRPEAGPAERPRSIVMVRTEFSGDGGTESVEMQPGSGRVRAGEDGIAVIEDVPPGVWSLRVTHADHAAQTLADLTVVDGQVLEVGPVAMTRGGGIRGSVTGFTDDDPIRGAMVELRAKGVEAEPRREAAMGGSYTIGGLAPGDYEVRARAFGRGPGGEAGPWATATVRAGEFTELELSVK